MNHLLKTFKNLINDLAKATGQDSEWAENFQKVSVTFKDKVISFAEVLKDPAYSNALEENHFAFEAVFDFDTLYNQDFIEKYALGVVQGDDLVEVIISLNKETNLALGPNKALFFSIESFIRACDVTGDQMNVFFERQDKERITNFFLPVEEEMRNDYCHIIPLEMYDGQEPSDLDDDNKEYLKRIIEKREDYTRVPTMCPIPDFFFFNNGALGSLKDTFDRNFFFLSMLHTSNKMEDNTFIIRGQKNVEIEWHKDFKPRNAELAYEIYKFCYGKEQTQDKLEIGRNVITLYLNSEYLEKLDEQLPKMEKTIKRHFSLYVNDKIKKYFDETKKAVDEAHKYAKETREAADKIVTNINASILGLITAVFSGIVIMGRGDRLYLLLAFGLHIVYFTFMYNLNAHFTRKREKEILDVYDQSIKYISSVSEDEVKEIKAVYINPASSSIKRNLSIYRRITFVLIGIMIALSLLVYPIPTNTGGDNQNNPTENQNGKVTEEQGTSSK